jgi:hypothetical protein
VESVRRGKVAFRAQPQRIVDWWIGERKFEVPGNVTFCDPVTALAFLEGTYMFANTITALEPFLRFGSGHISPS